jgi:hypothetical protein
MIHFIEELGPGVWAAERIVPDKTSEGDIRSEYLEYNFNNLIDGEIEFYTDYIHLFVESIR